MSTLLLYRPIDDEDPIDSGAQIKHAIGRHGVEVNMLGRVSGTLVCESLEIAQRLLARLGYEYDLDGSRAHAEYVARIEAEEV